MNCYYDTGILLELYTEEPESAKVRTFVSQRGEPIRISELHLAEFSSALRLKQFRGECRTGHVAAVLSHLDEDQRAGVLVMVAVDWSDAWRECRSLALAHVGTTGSRTLDTLHVACATLLHAANFITSDQRQSGMARKAGLKAINPVK